MPSWFSSGMSGAVMLPPGMVLAAGAAGAGAPAIGETGNVAGAPPIGETGSVDDGAPVRPDAPDSAVAAVWSSAAALAGFVAICCSMLSPGTPGTAGETPGSAAADGLSASATEHSPAAPITLAANSFDLRDMVIPILRVQV
ncbi:hypothetical protein MSAR_27610 [Mycolicibacterium sarraceniae]|uniref:Uncharacterized protein n=1 Tax=Mycolicibacterium sarraceniae TaxID=1534348 RepID=A0A7I7SU90_9MYCO|nr:hypothetical protein MSAR_27610 [Mycolicibacterium sarraceniae]